MFLFGHFAFFIIFYVLVARFTDWSDLGKNVITSVCSNLSNYMVISQNLQIDCIIMLSSDCVDTVWPCCVWGATVADVLDVLWHTCSQCSATRTCHGLCHLQRGVQLHTPW